MKERIFFFKYKDYLILKCNTPALVKCCMSYFIGVRKVNECVRFGLVSIRVKSDKDSSFGSLNLEGARLSAESHA